MKKLTMLLLSAGVLAGCATMIEGQSQPMTLLTPGASHAECTLYNKDMRYVIRTGETRNIMRSPEDLTVECFAEGNRHRKVIVDSQLEPVAIANVTNGVVPGVTYDHASKALYAYPETLTIDFSGVAAKPYDLPEYMRPELRGVNNGNMERYGADRIALPTDSDGASAFIQRRTQPVNTNPFGDLTGAGFDTPVAPLPVTEK